MKHPWLVVGSAAAAVVIVMAVVGEDRPGSAEVYERIAAETDCAKLERGLAKNKADAARRYSRRSTDPLYDVVRSYAKAYEARIDEVC
jgi:hypothetical protein